jgi:HAMP domain-containing protein
MTVRHLGDVLIYLGALAAAVTAIAAALGLAVRFTVVRPLQTWLREQIKAPVDAVHAEVTPNHGSSLKDAIDRIETTVEQLRRDLRGHIEHHPGRRR